MLINIKDWWDAIQNLYFMYTGLKKKITLKIEGCLIINEFQGKQKLQTEIIKCTWFLNI